MSKETREKILISQGNIIIKAGAGRGKTTLLSRKIQYDYENNVDHRVFAAITFTNKAVEEIKRKVGLNNGVVTTIDSFIMQEIVSPFIYHVYGDEYKKERLERDFNLKSSNFNDLLDQVKNISKIGVYKDIKKDFISELALKILEKSYVAQRYFKSKYYRIYIDEYQDVSKEQHNLFSYISNTLNINLFILGDPNQNIYSWRGASVDGFNYFYNTSSQFETHELKENFRCNLNIQKFLKIFEATNTEDLDFNYDNQVRFISKFDKLNIFLEENKEKKICILRRNQDDVRSLANFLKNFDFIPYDETGNYNSNYKWFTKELIHFILSEKSNKFNLINSIPFELTNTMVKDLNLNLKKIKKNKDYSEESIENIFKIIFPEISNEEYNQEFKIIEKIIADTPSHIIYNMHNVKNLVMTMHSSKGMEFEIVVVFAEELFDGNRLDENLNYVSMSRGKEILVIFYCDQKGQYLENLLTKLTFLQKIKFKQLNIN